MFSVMQFWVLLVGLLAFVLKFYLPNFPFDETQILSFVLFLLGLVGIYPKLRTRAFGNIFDSLEFWVLVAGLAGFIIHYYLPNFPLDEVAILGVLLFILKLLGIDPGLVAFAALHGVRAAEQHGGSSEEKKAYAIKAAARYLRASGALHIDLELLDGLVERSVYDQFNDKIVHRMTGGYPG